MPWSLSRFQIICMISVKATTLYVRSAISDIIVDDGPHGSFDVASRTLTWKNRNKHFCTKLSFTKSGSTKKCIYSISVTHLINASTRILKLTYLCICVVMGHVFNVSSESRYIHSHFLLHSKLLEDNVVTWKAFFQIGLNPNKFSEKRLLLWEQKTMASYIITITVMSASPNYFFYSSRLVESSSKKEGGYPRAFHQRFGPLMTSFPCAGRESWDS